MNVEGGDTPLPVRQRLADIVREHIVHQICERTLAPGDAIPSEAAIAASLHVSKPVVREALRELAAFGMVEIRHGRPTEVRALDHEPLVQFFDYATRTGDTSLRDLLELVKAIECDAAALAAERHTASEIARLEELMGRLHRAAEDRYHWSETQLEFHLLILEASKNDLMMFVYNALQLVIVAQKVFIHSQFHLRDPQASYRRQRAIFEAIKARDPDAARAAMRHHFDMALSIVATVMADRGAGGRPDE